MEMKNRDFIIVKHVIVAFLMNQLLNFLSPK